MSQPFSNLLMWGLMINPSTIFTKGGELMTCLRYIPQDKSSASPEKLMAARASLNTAIKRFGSGWSLWFECARNESTDYCEATEFPDRVSRAFDQCRRETFESAGQQFENTYVATLLYQAKKDSIANLIARFDNAGDGQQHDVQVFLEGVEMFKLELAGFMTHVSTLTEENLLTYLHNRISTDRNPILMPPTPAFLSEYLTDDTYVNGLSPMLGKHHMRTVRIKSDPTLLSPGIIDGLNDLNFPFNHVCRWLPLSYEDAQRKLTFRRDTWALLRKGFISKVFDTVFHRSDDGSKDNLNAIAKMCEASEALALLDQGSCSFGYWTHTVTVTHPDINVLEDRCQKIRRVFRGFATSIALDDSADAFLGSLPGHPCPDLGRFLGPSLSMAQVMPSTAPWAGPGRDEHLDGPPLIRCLSDGGTAFRLCMHQEGSDVGHMVVVGETGSGKSSLLKTILVSHRKYKGSRAFYIDRGNVAKLATLALGGTHHVLATEDDAVSLQPLAFIDIPSERNWAFGFIIGCLEQQGMRITPKHQEEVTFALAALASMPPSHRTLTDLRNAVQDKDIKAALAVFCMGGACGDLLDNSTHRIGQDADVKCFDVDELLKNKTALAPVVACIMHEIERSYDDQRPTLVVIDECKELISHPLIANQLDEMIRRARRENIQIVLATHTMTDIASSEIGPIITSSFKNKIFTANEDAGSPVAAAALRDICGLTPTQINLIATLKKKREYIMKTDSNWRKFELCLSEFEKAVVCGGSGEESKLIDRVLRSGPREEFFDRWLSYKMPLLAAAE